MTWQEMGKFDDGLLRDYRPGLFAPLDMPLGLQGMTVMVVFMILLFGGIVAAELWSILL